MTWLIFGAVLVGVIIGAIVLQALRTAVRAFGSSGEPTPNEAKAEARADAQETLHASNDDIARRIDELRARGRSGK